MVAATLLRVVNGGLQDDRLKPTVGNPDFSNFVRVFRKRSRFASQMLRVDFDTQPDFGAHASVTLPRKAELLGRIYLVVHLPDIFTVQDEAAAQGAIVGPVFAWTNNIGHALIERIAVEMGGVEVDRLDRYILEMMDELNEPLEKLRIKNELLHRNPSNYSVTTAAAEQKLRNQVVIPLPFWWTQNTQHYLPIDALSQDSVRLHVDFAGLTETYTSAEIGLSGELVELSSVNTLSNKNDICAGDLQTPILNTKFYVYVNGVRETLSGLQMERRYIIPEAYFLCEYVSVEETEAIQLRQSDLQYNIRQHNILPSTNTQGQPIVRIPIALGNPTEQVMWVFQSPAAVAINAHFYFGRELRNEAGTVWPDAILSAPERGGPLVVRPGFATANVEPFRNASFYINGRLRFEHASPSLFRAVIPSIYGRRPPLINRYIYNYTFMAPWSLSITHAARGFANWDKLPKKELLFEMAPGKNGVYPPLIFRGYTITWNILKIFGGRHALLFAY